VIKMATQGRMNVVKERLMTLISNSNSSLQPKASHISGEWDFHRRLVGKSGIIQNLPYVTVRLNTDILGDVYGRDIGGGISGSEERGNIITVTWSAHVLHSACRISGFDRHRNAQVLADEIIDYLVKEAGNQFTTYGISDIYEVNARESEPRDMPKKITRVIIEGKMDCVRPD